MTDDGKADWEEIQAMTPEQLDAELREAGADPVAVGDMGRAAAFLGKMVRFGWPGQMQHRELRALLAEVRQDERQRRERAIPQGLSDERIDVLAARAGGHWVGAPATRAEEQAMALEIQAWRQKGGR